eukprot:1824267-Pleurochrysis_carterae.AAC.1
MKKEPCSLHAKKTSSEKRNEVSTHSVACGSKTREHQRRSEWEREVLAGQEWHAAAGQVCACVRSKTARGCASILRRERACEYAASSVRARVRRVRARCRTRTTASASARKGVM